MTSVTKPPSTGSVKVEQLLSSIKIIKINLSFKIRYAMDSY